MTIRWAAAMVALLAGLPRLRLLGVEFAVETFAVVLFQGQREITATLEVNMHTERANTILLFQYTFHGTTYLYRPVTSGVRCLQFCTVLVRYRVG